MEEVRLVAGQPLVEEGEKSGFFFKVKNGKLKSELQEYSSGDLIGVVECFTSSPFRHTVVAEEDSVVIKLSLEDLEDENLFDEIMKYIITSMVAIVEGGPGREVLEDLSRRGDIRGMAEIAGEDEIALSAIEEMLTFQKFPEMPDDLNTSLKLLEKVESEGDKMKFALHCIAFARKFPQAPKTPEILMKASEVYMDELGDRYSSRYVLKLLFLFQPNSDLLKKALKRLIKLLREDRDPEWFEYLERFLLHFPKEEVNIDEIS